MAFIIDDLMRELSRLGFYDFLLPWLFAFAVIYGLLYKAGIFGSINKRISGILAFVIAFFVAGWGGRAIADFLRNLFAGTSIVIAAVISIILFVALLGFTEKDWKGKSNKAIYIAIAIGVVLFIIATTGDSVLGGSRLGLFGIDAPVLALVMIILLIIAVIFITSGKEEEGGVKPEKKEKE